jgi:V/A-type H+-transporting ATPase subunit I
MSIVALEKVTLFGLAADKRRALERLQELGCVHLQSLRAVTGEAEKSAPQQPEAAGKALRYLLETGTRRHQVVDPAGFDLDAVLAQVEANRERTLAATDRRDFLETRIRDLEPWGDFHLPDPATLGGYRLWFYIVPNDRLRRLPRGGIAWSIVHRDARQSHVVAVARDEPGRDAMPAPRIHAGTVPLAELRGALEGACLELEDLAAERAALTRWIHLITRHLAHAENQAALWQAGEMTLDTGDLFVIQGWAPRRAVPAIRGYAAGLGLALVAAAPGADDRPPTLLNNPEKVSGGQDLVSFFQTPGYKGWDPSRVLFFSFALFFAMILGDAGYAALLLAFLLAGWRRLGRSPAGRRLRYLALAMLGASVVYGVMVGSYFGVSPAPGGLLAGLQVLDINDYPTMMRLSVAVGVIHVTLANLITAWRQDTWRARLAPLGWCLAVVGGFIMWVGGPTGVELGTDLLGAGLVGVLLFTSARPWRRPADLALRLVDGLLGLTRVSGALGDILSYLRLFALGLASASLAVTFNTLAHDVHAALPGIGLLFALLILLLGHALNLALGIMSGVVHGLRLNYIEFYNWSLSDEGYPFRSFAKKEVTT